MLSEDAKLLCDKFVRVGDLVAANYSTDTLKPPPEGVGIVIAVYTCPTSAPDRCLVTFSKGGMLLLDEDDLLKV